MKRVGTISDWLKKLRRVEQHALQFQSDLEDGDVLRQDFWNMPDCPQFATARLIPEPAVSALRCRRDL